MKNRVAEIVMWLGFGYLLYNEYRIQQHRRQFDDALARFLETVEKVRYQGVTDVTRNEEAN